MLIFRETRANWAGLNLYQRFEQVVVLLLGFLISVVIVAALINVLQGRPTRCSSWLCQRPHSLSAAFIGPCANKTEQCERPTTTQRARRAD
jgi:hypothetical protein